MSDNKLIEPISMLELAELLEHQAAQNLTYEEMIRLRNEDIKLKNSVIVQLSLLVKEYEAELKRIKARSIYFKTNQELTTEEKSENGNN